jgi:hypothetical protein
VVLIEPALPIPGRIASLLACPKFYKHRQLWIDGEQLVVLRIYDSQWKSPPYRVDVHGAGIDHRDLCDVRPSSQNLSSFVKFLHSTENVSMANLLEKNWSLFCHVTLGQSHWQ